jgi:hypothetical protein
MTLSPFSTEFQAQFLTYGYTVIPKGLKQRDDAWEVIGVWSGGGRWGRGGGGVGVASKLRYWSYQSSQLFCRSPGFNHWKAEKVLWIEGQALSVTYKQLRANTLHTQKYANPQSTVKPCSKALFVYLLRVHSSDLLWHPLTTYTNRSE